MQTDKKIIIKKESTSPPTPLLEERGAVPGKSWSSFS
jgi:hypothetical protein